jgi:hypothetical protein
MIEAEWTCRKADKHDIRFDELPVSLAFNHQHRVRARREQQGLPHQLVFLHDLELIKDAGAQ